MIDGGAGLINIPLDKWDQWNDLIANYYRTNDMTEESMLKYTPSKTLIIYSWKIYKFLRYI